MIISVVPHGPSQETVKIVSNDGPQSQSGYNNAAAASRIGAAATMTTLQITQVIVNLSI